MKVPHGAYAASLHDADTEALFAVFDEERGSRVLEVGAHDEPVANILTEQGFHVIGVDLREYHAGQDLGRANESRPCNYEYVRGDFCDLPYPIYSEWLDHFDAIISLSAIEHFGLGTYDEGNPHYYYDVIALRCMWEFLKEGGTAYVSVPFGSNYIEAPPHWRVYDGYSLRRRLVQDFHVEGAWAFVAAECEVAGRKCDWRSLITWEEACGYSGDPPHVSVIMKLKKVAVKRLAPDGR